MPAQPLQGRCGLSFQKGAVESTAPLGRSGSLSLAREGGCYAQWPQVCGERVHMSVGVQAMVAVHTACPFGSSSAVYNWERVGAMLAALASRVLHLATLRYVDDFFAPERCCMLTCTVSLDKCACFGVSGQRRCSMAWVALHDLCASCLARRPSPTAKSSAALLSQCWGCRLALVRAVSV